MSQTLSTEKLIMQYSGVYSTDRKTNATKEWTISLVTLGISLLDSLDCPGCVGYERNDNFIYIYVHVYVCMYMYILSI